jgi:hypothetical protein
MSKKEREKSETDIWMEQEVFPILKKLNDETFNRCNGDTTKVAVRLLGEAKVAADDWQHTRVRQGGSSAKGKNRKK